MVGGRRNNLKPLKTPYNDIFIVTFILFDLIAERTYCTVTYRTVALLYNFESF